MTTEVIDLFNRFSDLYNAANIEKYEDIHLQTLAEECANLEQRVWEICDKLSERDRCILQAYIDLRNDLECESIKAALRIGKDFTIYHS